MYPDRCFHHFSTHISLLYYYLISCIQNILEASIKDFKMKKKTAIVVLMHTCH